MVTWWSRTAQSTPECIGRICVLLRRDVLVHTHKHNAAVICVARRRCDLIHAMLTTATPYDPSRSKLLAEAA